MRLLLTTLVIAIALLATGCGGDDDHGDPSGGGGPRRVVVDDFEFMPERVEVDAGVPVVWVNRDTAPHTATAADVAQRASFDTKVIKEARQSPTVVFDNPGTYAYVCDLHPFMKGVVVVK